MKNLIALGASNSKDSINKKLAVYTASKVKNAKVEVVDLNDYELPLYGVDLEAKNGIPEKAEKLSEVIESSDGLVISLAEHNGSYTVAFKNTIDWLSRLDIRVWKDKPLLLLATSPGGRGGKMVLETAKTSFPFVGGYVVADFSLPNFYDNFTEEGISNNESKAELEEKIQLFEGHLNNK